MEIAEQLSALLAQPLNPNRENVSVKCPLHDDRVASMSINLRKGVWYCWGCSKGGKLQSLARLLGGELDDADMAIMSAHTEPEPEPVDFWDNIRELPLVERFNTAWQQYAKPKGLRDEVPSHFGVRHQRDTLVFPYFDGDRCVALRYRARDGRKWYETGSERTIYNINEIRGAKYAVLAEGESDTHALWSHFYGSDGVKIGGIPGANNSVEKWELWALDLMWSDKVWIAFDNDEAGNRGAERAIEVLGDKAYRLTPPDPHNDWNDALLAGVKPALGV